MSARPPQLDGDEIAAHVANLSRAPFQDLLRIVLEAQPDVASIREHGQRFPDRYGQLLVMCSRLAGYSDKLAVDHSHTLNVVELMQLSDAELSERLQTALAKLGIPVNAGDVIDLEALPNNGS